jgi:hypothetical protein
VNRTAAQATLAAWHQILADPDDRVTYGTAVQALAAAADYYAAETARLEATTRADQADITQLRELVRGQRAPKSFTLEANAITDARQRGQCLVFRENKDTAQFPEWGPLITSTYHSVPIEQAYVAGVLRDRWQRATPVELDQAGTIERRTA